ncbi:MAG: hypothetical protein E6Q97_38465 [Desulfurellales bacterium]|nr:MAG: hypothetical protein E6Q97_38465 [Desulfurellales bacterium]
MISTDRIITKYDADPSGHLRAVEQIKKSQDQMRRDLTALASEATGASSSMVTAFSKLVLSIAGVTASLALLKKGFATYQSEARLAAASMGANIKQIEDASLGLLNNTQSMELASAGLNGAFRLTQSEIENAAMAMRNLTRKGNDADDVIKKITASLREGKSKGLDGFGISIESTGDKVKDFQALMAALAIEADQARGSTLSEGEAIQKLGNDFDDSIARILAALGKLATLAEPLLSKIADLADMLASSIERVGEFGRLTRELGKDLISFGGTDRGEFFNRIYGPNSRAEELALANGYAANSTMGVALAEMQIAVQDRINDDNATKMRRTLQEGAVEMRGAIIDGVKSLGVFVPDYTKKRKPGGGQFAGGPRFTRGTDYYDFGRASGDFDSSAFDQFAEASTMFGADSYSLAGVYDYGGDYNNYLNSKTGSKLEGIFGPIEDFNLYSKAWQGLESAVSSAMSAWIDGSKGLDEALKDSLMAMGKNMMIEMTMQALKHGAYAIGSLAMGNVAQAAGHGASAAKFAAGAAAIGGLLSMGGGFGGGSSSGGAPSPVAPYQRQGEVGATIVIGDSFAEDSPRMRQRKAQRALQLATGSGQGAEYD